MSETTQNTGFLNWNSDITANTTSSERLEYKPLLPGTYPARILKVARARVDHGKYEGGLKLVVVFKVTTAEGESLTKRDIPLHSDWIHLLNDLMIAAGLIKKGETYKIPEALNAKGKDVVITVTANAGKEYEYRELDKVETEDFISRGMKVINHVQNIYPPHAPKAAEGIIDLNSYGIANPVPPVEMAPETKAVAYADAAIYEQAANSVANAMAQLQNEEY